MAAKDNCVEMESILCKYVEDNFTDEAKCLHFR